MWIFVIPFLLCEGLYINNYMSTLFYNWYECHTFFDGVNTLDISVESSSLNLLGTFHVLFVLP